MIREDEGGPDNKKNYKLSQETTTRAAGLFIPAQTRARHFISVNRTTCYFINVGTAFLNVSALYTVRTYCK